MDPNLEAACNCALGITGPPTALDLAGLSALDASGRGITNLAGLELATNLTQLNLARNAIADVSPLGNLSGLAELSVEDNLITTVAPLAGLAGLRTLAVDNNPVGDYALLGRLTNLANLSVCSGQVTELNWATNLAQLTSLVMSHNKVSDLGPVAALTNLMNLDLRWNPITNHAALAGLPGLASLHVGGTSPPDLGFAGRLTGLTLLEASDNGLMDLSPLAGLTNLSYLALSGNPWITNYQVVSALSNLSSVEFRGNGLTNVWFFAGLRRLAYADLAQNHLSDVSPLAGLTNLSVVLDANPGLEMSGLARLTNSARLWLNGNSLTNLAFLQNLGQLTALGLDGSLAGDISGVGALTNLEHLTLSGTGASGYEVLTNCGKLAGLRLESDGLGSGLDWLTNLTQLSFLSLSSNRIWDVSGSVPRLTNLSSLYLAYNRLTNSSTLAGLPRLRRLELGGNLLGWGPDAANLVESLRCAGAQANLEPTNGPPYLVVFLATAPDWYVTANRGSSLTLGLYDDLIPSDEFILATNSANPALLPTENIGLSVASGYGTLTARPVAGQTGLALLSVTVMDAPSPFGQSTITNLLAHIMLPDTNFHIADQSLSNCVWQALGGPASAITSVDMLSLVSLTASGVGITNLWGLQWATNLAELSLAGNGISDLSSLQALIRLSRLTLAQNSIGDISALAQLRNLAFLSLGQNPITNCEVISGLTNLAELSLAGIGVTNLSFLSGLGQLRILDVSDNRLTDVSWLGSGLTNLNTLDLSQNRLLEIGIVTNLASLISVDVRFNLLAVDTDPAIEALNARGVWVDDLPQRQAPSFDVRGQWVMGVGVTSSIPVVLSDNGPAEEQLAVGMAAGNSVLRASFMRETNGNASDLWTLTASPESATVTTITLAATNDVGMWSIATITAEATVLVPIGGDSPWLDSSGLSWMTSPDGNWFGQGVTTHSGTTAQSGVIGNSQDSWLQTTVMGPGRVSFWWKVSSEAGYDWLAFTEGTEQRQISGEVDWHWQWAYVPFGAQTLTWTYSKNDSVSAGADAGWVADVEFTPGPWLEIAGGGAGKPAQFILHAVPGRLYAVQTTTNLAGGNWRSLAPVVAVTNVAMPFIDTNAVSENRFYRLLDGTLWLEGPDQVGGEQVQVCVHNPAGLWVELQASTNWTSWTSVLGPTNQPILTVSEALVTNAAPRFYRAVATQ